jgi:hypothetical protein
MDDQTQQQPWSRIGNLLGMAGVALAIIGLFLFTIFLEPAAIILGILAWREGNKSINRGEGARGGREKLLGRISIVGGVAVLVMFMLLVLFVSSTGEPA